MLHLDDDDDEECDEHVCTLVRCSVMDGKRHRVVSMAKKTEKDGTRTTEIKSSTCAIEYEPLKGGDEEDDDIVAFDSFVL